MAESSNAPLNERLRAFRESHGMSRATLAEGLGITPITLYRWETGSTRPSPLAAEKLHELGFGAISPNETNLASISRLKSLPKGAGTKTHAITLRDAGKAVIKTSSGRINIVTAPFVRNGPPDQVEFHETLLNLQGGSNHLPAATIARRLSLVEEVEGIGETAQTLLERPKSTAVSWNSNYGTHGWHRYVGRFPPHLIRALLNHFGADAKTVVCDPFAGSGTTAVECRLLGIPFVGIEICPLSCLMTRTKATFPATPQMLVDVAKSFSQFYEKRSKSFLKGRSATDTTHKEVLERKGNSVPTFTNIEKWFTPEALLGTSIAVEFGMSLEGFAREATLLAISAKMRSIGNLDVDVVRAEYRKTPRKNVDVGKLVDKQLHKMANDIKASISSHADIIGEPTSITLHEASVLDVDLPDKSIDCIITSPPYGVEAISYLRTHLLSYRALFTFLGHDPYDTRDKTIGAEYIADFENNTKYSSELVSPTCRIFFANLKPNPDSKYNARRAAMIHFCDDMLAVGKKMSKWLKFDGQVAFIIGNKRLGDDIIPMDTIVIELFANCGLEFSKAIKHKLKTNNSNSQVPWQERIIQEESILLFKKIGRKP